MRKHRLLLILAMTALCTNARAQWDYTIKLPRPINWTDTVSITVIGDVMMHSRQMDYDYTKFLSRLGSITRDADVSIANMEFTLAGKPYSGYPSFSAPDGYAADAADKGVDVFLLGNNHILDKGQPGLRRTLKQYENLRDSLGTQYTGAAADSLTYELVNPLVIACKGIRFALINFTYGTNYPRESSFPHVSRMSREDVGKMFQKAKEKNVDYVIALPHWGTEYQLNHSKEQEEWAEWLVDQGADLVIGAHPHVVQDTSHINGVPIIYSLGNAVSNMSAENTRLELAVTARFVRGRDGTKTMIEPKLEFLWCTLPGKLTDGYATIKVSDYIGKRDEWIEPADYDNMIATLKRVQEATGISITE